MPESPILSTVYKAQEASMSIAASLIELLLTRHHVRSSKPYVIEAAGVLAGLLAVIVFAASAVALLVFTGLWIGFTLMTGAGLSDLNAGLLVCVGILVIVAVVVWAIDHLRRRLARLIETLVNANTAVPGEAVVSTAISGTAKVAGAFRRGLMGAWRKTRNKG